MGCLNCGAPHKEGELLCERCAASMGELLPAGNRPNEDAAAQTGILNVRQTLFMLVLGIIPIVGLVACLLWGYGPDMPPARRNLALALLWLHGAGLAAVIVALCAWVMGMANYPFYI